MQSDDRWFDWKRLYKRSETEQGKTGWNSSLYCVACRAGQMGKWREKIFGISDSIQDIEVIYIQQKPLDLTGI